MVLHVVLFRPRADLTDDDRAALLAAFELARRRIPWIRHAWVGRRIRHGRAYEQAVSGDYPYAAILGFDDVEALKENLTDPAHEDLGALFGRSVEASLICDFSGLAVEDLNGPAPGPHQ